MTGSRRRPIARLVVVTVALGASLLIPAGPAAAVPANVQAGLSLSPARAAVGTVVQVSATATNLTDVTITQVSMGVDVPPTLGYSALARPAQAVCRATFVTDHRLVYCSLHLAPHETATLGLTLRPTAAGTFTLKSYARQTYTNNDTFATATLTMS